MSKPKYIDSDKVIDYANQEVSTPFFSIEREGAEDVVTYKNKWAFVKQVMVGMPAADVVEVVRCRECKRYQFADNRAFGFPVKREGQPSECEYWDDESNFCTLNRPSTERHGRWEDVEHAPNGLLYATCSVCGKRQTIEATNYCGECGADMREAKNECDDCFIPMFYNLEDDDSICKDCGVGE